MKNLKTVMIGVVFLSFFASQSSYAQWTLTDRSKFHDSVLVGRTITSLAASGTNLFAGLLYGGVLVSTNNGDSWQFSNTGLKDSNVTSLAVSGANLFAGTTKGVFRSSNNGASWTVVDTTSGIATLAAGSANILAGTGNSGARISRDFGQTWSTVNVNNGYWYDFDKVATVGSYVAASTIPDWYFYSSDNGVTWTQTGPPVMDGDHIRELVSGAGKIFVSTIYSTFLSKDTGKNWETLNLADSSGVRGAVHITSCAASGKYLFIGSEWSSVYYSTDNAATWTWIPVYQSSFGPYPATTGIAVIGNYVFSGCYGVGVYRQSISNLPVINPLVNDVPAGLLMSVSRPGSSRRTVQISFSLPSSEQVRIQVFDMTGRCMAFLADSRFGAGAHSLTWYIRAAPAGIYLIRLQAGRMKCVKYITVCGDH